MNKKEKPIKRVSYYTIPFNKRELEKYMTPEKAQEFSEEFFKRERLLKYNTAISTEATSFITINNQRYLHLDLSSLPKGKSISSAIKESLTQS